MIIFGRVEWGEKKPPKINKRVDFKNYPLAHCVSSFKRHFSG